MKRRPAFGRLARRAADGPMARGGSRRFFPPFSISTARLKIDLIMSDRYENLIAEGAELALRVGEQPDLRASWRAQARKRKTSLRRRAKSLPGAARRARGALADLAATGCDWRRSRRARRTWSWAARRDGRTEVAPVEPRVYARSAAGVGVASIWMCAEELASGALTEVLTDYALDPIVAFVVVPAGRRPSQKARVFANYLEQAVTQSRTSSLEPATGSARR